MVLQMEPWAVAKRTNASWVNCADFNTVLLQFVVSNTDQKLACS